MGMVDISEKTAVTREAVAEGTILLKSRTIDAIKQKQIKKGDTLSIAEAAGMLAVKKTPILMPHCHPIPIDKIDFEFETNVAVVVRCRVKTTAKTGVEMEALVGATTALNVIWDMVKYLEKDNGQYSKTEITNVRIVSKTKGGKNGRG